MLYIFVCKNEVLRHYAEINLQLQLQEFLFFPKLLSHCYLQNLELKKFNNLSIHNIQC